MKHIAGAIPSLRTFVAFYRLLWSACRIIGIRCDSRASRGVHSSDIQITWLRRRDLHPPWRLDFSEAAGAGQGMPEVYQSQSIESGSAQVASVEDVILEEHFQSIVGSRHMRQWFKLRKAYAMMEERRPHKGPKGIACSGQDHERTTGLKYDLVLCPNSKGFLGHRLEHRYSSFGRTWSWLRPFASQISQRPGSNATLRLLESGTRRS